MNRKPLRLLVVEDSPDDAELVELEVAKHGYEPTVLRVENEGSMREALESREWDAIIADYSVPGFGSVPALRLLKETGRDIPFIIVSGSISDETAVAAMRAGAHDYLLKDNIARLVPAIEREVQEAAIRRQKRHAEAALQESEQRLRATFEHVAVGIIEIDEKSRILVVNDRVCDILGYGRDELLSLTIDELTAPEDRPQSARINGDILAGRTGSIAYEKRYLKRDGTRVWVHVTVSGIRDSRGTVVRAVGTVEDISARKNAEFGLVEAKALAENRLAQLQATLNSMTEGLYILDKDGNPVIVNKSLQQMFGLDPRSLLSDNQVLFEIFDLHGDPIDRSNWPAARVLRGETIHRYEVRVRRRDIGKEWIASYNGAPVVDGNGHVLMAVLTIEDVSNAKLTQQALIRSEKLAATGRLAATIAHEINNPLESITNVVYLLKDHIADASGREYIDIIETEIQTLSRIATQTLRFHRENGQPVEYKLGEVVTELLEFYRPKMMKHGVTVSSRLETDGLLFGFVGEIRQVVSNLLINAIEATPRSGRVVINLYEGTDWRTGRKGYRLTVADTGHGIDRLHKSHIFEPFFTTKGEKGTGLGLWVSMGIVDRAGGNMRVWSTQRTGRSGSCFSIFLPSQHALKAKSGHRRYERNMGEEAAG